MNPPPLLHPTAETLQAYGLGRLTNDASKAIHQHLAECAECRRRVAGLLGSSPARARESSPAPEAPGGRTAAEEPDTYLPELAHHPDYEIKRELGRGGMGVVYLAHNQLMGRDEVLKVVGQHLLKHRSVLERFQREIRSAARLQHPNIVNAYSAFRCREGIVFALEYVDGYDLAGVVKDRGPLPVARACLFVHQAALGLQHAHELGMVHRDIKPANLMVARRGDHTLVKILDFGLSKASREDPVDGGLTQQGQMLGTPDYIAPEQISDAHKADIRADIYSLGCTLYHLLSGGPPFQGRKSLYDILQAHHSIDARPLNLARSDVPLELAALVAKMMAKDLSDRFQTPGEVARALTPYFKSRTKEPGAPAVAHHFVPHEAGPRPPVSEVGTESLTGELFRGLKLDSDVARRPQQFAPEPQRPWLPQWRPPRRWAIAAAAGAAALLLLGIILHVATDNGSIKIELNDPKAEVKIDGQAVRIENLGEPISLRAGQHKLVILRGAEEIHAESFTVKRGANPALVVTLEPPPKVAEAVSPPGVTQAPSPSPGATAALTPAPAVKPIQAKGKLEVLFRPAGTQAASALTGFLGSDRRASWGQTDLELSPQGILNRSDPKAPKSV